LIGTKTKRLNIKNHDEIAFGEVNSAIQGDFVMEEYDDAYLIVDEKRYLRIDKRVFNRVVINILGRHLGNFRF